MTAATVTSYDLGSLGQLLAVTPAASQSCQTAERGHVTVILDRSGSMGPWVAYARAAVHAALLQLGYDSDAPITLLTFDSHSERVTVEGRDPTVGDLVGGALDNIKSRGSTQMAGIVPMLEAVLSDAAHVAHNILVISDGDVWDREAVTRLAADAVAARGQQPAVVCANLLRVKTSVHAAPDTAALACIGAFGNTCKAPVTDVVVHGASEELALLGLTAAIVDGFASAPVRGLVEVAAPEGCELRRLPTAAPLQAVTVACGVRTHLLVPAAVASLRVGGEEVRVEAAGAPTDPETLLSFYGFVEQQLKMWRLMHCREAELQAVVAWFGRLQEHLEAETGAAMNGPADLTVMGRARALAAAARRRTGSILDRIRQLGNSDRVAQLNSQQQADWLRGVGDTRGGRALARRAEAAGGGELDYAARARDAVRALAARGEVASPPGAEASYVSLATAGDCLAACVDLLPAVEELGVAEVMQVAGGVGVPFAAPVGDYVDPWTLRLTALHPGLSLAEGDVAQFRAQAVLDPEATMTAFGDANAAIKGVIALRRADPAAYDAYTSGAARGLFEMQASLQMRHAVACVPFDAVALSAAGAWALLGALGQAGRLSEAQAVTLAALRENLGHLIGGAYRAAPFQELYDSLKEADCRPCLSGDRDVSGVLRPVAALLRFHGEDEAGGLALPRVLRALYHLDCYVAAKRAFRGEADARAARAAALKAALRVDFQQHGTPLQPLFQEEPAAPAHCDEVAVKSVRLPGYLPSLHGLVGLHAILTGAPAPDAGAAVGCSPGALRAVAAVQSLVAASQGERIDTETRTSLLPDPESDSDAVDYLRETVRGLYAADYATRLEGKRREEAAVKLAAVVEALVGASDVDAFRSALVASEITNRQQEGYTLLADRLMDGGEHVMARMDKLSLLLTGRDPREPAVVVWANGNFYSGRWAPYEAVIGAETGGEARLAQLREMRKEFGMHRYREGSPNRHGHGSDFPSYWGLGYPTLADMQAAVPAAEFEAYMDAHCRSKGCCMPLSGKLKR